MFDGRVSKVILEPNVVEDIRFDLKMCEMVISGYNRQLEGADSLH